jgi:hypothetical protein
VAIFGGNFTAITNRLCDHPKPACAGSRAADDGRLWVVVAANLFGNTRRLQIASAITRNLPAQVRAQPTSALDSCRGGNYSATLTWTARQIILSANNTNNANQNQKLAKISVIRGQKQKG